MLSPKEIKNKIRICQNAAQLMVWPHIHAQIMAVISDETANLARLSAIVGMDPALSAGLLRIANSVYYSQKQPVTAISRAVMLIGLTEFRRLASTTALIQQFSSKEPVLDLNINSLWLHSVVTARVAGIIRGLYPYLDPEEVYTAGLLHDLGKVFMVCYLRDDVIAIAELRHQKRLSWWKAEQEYGLDHTVVGKAIAQVWGLPPGVANVIAGHHDPLDTQDYFLIKSIVYLADIMSNRAGFSYMANFPKYLDPAIMLRLQMTPEKIKSCWKEFCRIKDDIVSQCQTILSNVV